MGAVRANLIFALAIGGGVAASQMPEFAQQYRQRIGGAIEELSRVVAEFDRDAAASGLTRAEAIDKHAVSAEEFFRARGRSMEASIQRYDTLVRQRSDFETTSETWRPFVLARSDEATLQGAWRDFRPGIPVTLAGVIWAAAGFCLAALAAGLMAALTRWTWRATRFRHADEGVRH